MVIFRIFKNLFRLVWGLGFRFLFWPVAMIGRHPILMLLLVGTMVIYAMSSDPTNRGTPVPPRAAHMQRDKNGVPIIDPIAKREDGDSRFATDLYQLMSDEERAAYSRSFYQAMNSTADNDTTSWSNFNIQGAIRPADTFENNEGTRCRHFGEVLKVHSIEQTLTGTACAKPDGSWCKLKPNATPACGLGHEPGMFESIQRSLGNLF